MVRWFVDCSRRREMNGTAISGSDGKLQQVSMNLPFFFFYTSYGFKLQLIPLAL